MFGDMEFGTVEYAGVLSGEPTPPIVIYLNPYCCKDGIYSAKTSPYTPFPKQDCDCGC